jgi:hypothetical protein
MSLQKIKWRGEGAARLKQVRRSGEAGWPLGGLLNPFR